MVKISHQQILQALEQKLAAERKTADALEAQFAQHLAKADPLLFSTHDTVEDCDPLHSLKKQPAKDLFWLFAPLRRLINRVLNH